MRKIASFILALCMALTMLPAHAEEIASVHESYEVLAGMGLIEKPANEIMTRAEFTQVLYDARHFADEEMQSSSWNDSFFGSLEMESNKIEEVGTHYESFTDIDPYGENSEAIAEIVNVGIMNGTSETEFRPDQNVKNIEVIKSILNMIGYKTLCYMQGGYYGGYLAYADQLGISDGVSVDPKAESTAADVARIIYNTLNVKIMEFKITANGKVVAPSETETFLTKIMHVDFIKGIITDNGITSLYGASDVGKGYIVCGNVKLRNTDKNAGKISDLLGYQVEAYYFIGGDKEGKVIYAKPTKRNEVITFDINDFESYAPGEVQYNVDNKLKTAKISDAANFIYNDVALTSIPSDIFDFENGYVILIAPEGGKSETVIIKSYVSMYVGNVDKKEYIIYNKSFSTNDAKYPASLSIKEAYENETLTIKNAAGDIVTIDSILNGSIIDVAQNGEIMEIVVSDKTVSKFKVAGIEQEDEGTILSNGESKYILDDSYDKAQNVISYQLGETLNLYLNSFDKIVWIEKGDDYTLNVGYFLRILSNDDSDNDEGEYTVKLINSDGAGVKLKLAGKVKYGDEKTADQSAYKKLKAEDVYKRLNVMSPRLIGYGLNADKEIDIIELPLAKRGGRNRLQLINSGTDLMYKNDAGGKFLDKIWTDTSTIVFTTPPNPADIYDDTKYSCVNKSTLFSSDGKYTVSGYGTEANGIRAKYMTMQIEAQESLELSEEKCQFFIVTDITRGLDIDGDEAIQLSGIKTSSYRQNIGLVGMTLYAKDEAGKKKDGTKVNPAEYATATIDLGNATPKYYAVKKGDIIRYRYDSDETMPIGIEILYRADMEGDFTVNGKGAKGALLGVKEYADANSTPYNLFAFSSTQGSMSTDMDNYYSRVKVVYGSLYSVDSDVGTLTNRDLSISSFDPTLGKTTYVPVATGSTRVTINYDKKNISVALADKADYKPYVDCGGSCSKILTITMNGWTTFTFIINGEYGK